jgi:AMMECR1 domain-containing protein
MPTDADLGQALLLTARNAIGKRFGHAASPVGALAELAEPGATFVTLTQRGQLRGCIGSLEAQRPLADRRRRKRDRRGIQRSALRAAGRPDEFPRTRVEVSLLTPAEPLTFTRRGRCPAPACGPACRRPDPELRQATCTFLPQVWEQLPEPRQFMAQLKQKAGLPADFWRWWHALDDGRIQCDLCPRDCKLHEGQRGACFVRQRKRRNGADHLRPQFGLLHRPDREEAAQPLLPRLQRAVLRHRRLQPGLQVLPELGHLEVAATWTA